MSPPMTSDNAREELARLIHLKTPFSFGGAEPLADAILAAGYEKRPPDGEGAGAAQDHKPDGWAADIDAEIVGMLRESANRVFGGNCTFADDDLKRLERAALAARASHAPAADASGVE